MQNLWSALRPSCLAAAVALATVSAGCSGSDDTPPPPNPFPATGERLVYADGWTLHLSSVTNGNAAHVAQASLPSAGFLPGHMIFGIVKHPTQPWLYATSFNDCWDGTDWCWGNGRIDRFTVSGNSIAHAGLVFKYDANATLASCASDDWETDYGYTGQFGSCAPVDGVFSPDGTRLYIQDDSWDILHIFSVSPSGALTMLSEGGDLDMHGLAMDPTGVNTYLYNGSRVLDVAADTGTNVYTGAGGNYSTWLTGNRLLSTSGSWSTSDVVVYSLADPRAPFVVDQLIVGTKMVRAVAINPANTRIVSAGRNSVATVAFDGANLTLEDSFDPSGGGTTVENRGIALVNGGTHAAVTWFKQSPTAPGGLSGGLTVYSIDGSGTLASTATVNLPRPARAVKTLSF